MRWSFVLYFSSLEVLSEGSHVKIGRREREGMGNECCGRKLRVLSQLQFASRQTGVMLILQRSSAFIVL